MGRPTTLRERAWGLLLVLAAACGDASEAASSDESSTHDHDAGAVSSDAAQADGGSERPGNAPIVNGCAPADYVDRTSASAERTVVIAATGLTYSPKCMIVSRGQTVSWTGSLTAHPLAPGNSDDENAGDPGNPITRTSTGSMVAFTFDRAGTFPYYCELHSFGAGSGMAGSIMVR